MFPTAELFANNESVASLSFCCHLCPCAFPVAGITTILQIPVISDPTPASPAWRNWTNVSPGIYRLVARASGASGLPVETPAVTIQVLPPDLNLRLHVSLFDDGVLRFVLPDGSLVMGGFVLEASDDLLAWHAVVAFSPGNIAAFAEDRVTSASTRIRFYRAVNRP